MSESASGNSGPVEIVLQVGAEGGSIALLRQAGNPVIYAARIVDQSLLISDEGPEIARQGDWSGWDPAIEALDRYPWRRLTPLTVHSDYARRIWELVSAKRDQLEAHRLQDWSHLCGVAPSSGGH